MTFVILRTKDGKTLAQTVRKIEKNSHYFLMTDFAL